MMFSIVAVLVGLFFVGALTTRAAWDFEVGRQYAAGGSGPYALVRYSRLLMDVTALDSQLWIVPEAGFVAPADWYGRGQILFDTPLATLGLDRKGGEQTYTRLFVRFGW
jgi:hypothetical protein